MLYAEGVYIACKLRKSTSQIKSLSKPVANKSNGEKFEKIHFEGIDKVTTITELGKWIFMMLNNHLESFENAWNIKWKFAWKYF